MSDGLTRLLNFSKTAAKDKVLESIRVRYFPEVWYALENWLSHSKTMQALEIGTGIGLVTEALAKSGWQVELIDPSLTRLAKIKQRLEAARLHATLEQSLFETLPFANESFDAIACINSLEFANEPKTVLTEIYRVLKPGGRAVIATFNRSGPWGLPAIVRLACNDEAQRQPKLLSKSEFTKLLIGSRLYVHGIKERAQYLPAGKSISKMKLPVAGSFIALVEKQVKSERGFAPDDRTDDTVHSTPERDLTED